MSEFLEQWDAFWSLLKSIGKGFMWLIQLPVMLASYVANFTANWPGNDLIKGLDFISMAIAVYAIIFWGMWLWRVVGRVSLILLIICGYFLGRGIWSMSYAGLWPALALLIATALMFHRGHVGQVMKGGKFLGRGAGKMTLGLGRFGGGAIRSMGGTLRGFRNDPKAKIYAEGFASLYEAFETDPKLQKHGMFNTPGFTAALSYLRDELAETHPSDKDLIHAMYDKIKEGIDLREGELAPLAEVMRDTMIRMA